MTIDDPVLLAEVAAAFYDYERALMADDLAELDRLFHDAPTTNRYGVGEMLYGIEEIRAFRARRGGSPQRLLGRVAITVYGEKFATADAEFERQGRGALGRQTQSWVKFSDGWKIVSAHISLQGTSS